MPSRPRQADIDVYNAWARRNGEAPWGAPAAAPAAAPPGPQSPIAAAVAGGARARLNSRTFFWELTTRGGNRIRLSNREGVLNRSGHEYSSIARRLGLDNYELNQWREGLHMLAGSNADVAYDVNGQMRFVRRYNAATGQYEAVGFGRSYFRTHRSRFTISLPVLRLVRRARNGAMAYVETNNGEVWKYITDDQIEEFVSTHAPHSFADLGVAPSEASPEQQKAWIREALQIYVNQMPQIGRYQQLTEFDDSDCVFVYDDSREPMFDEEITTIRQDGELTLELVLNRPLRGVVIVPDEMHGKLGIFPVASEEALPGENCIENQLILAITKRKCKDTRARRRKMVDGKKVTLTEPELLVGNEEDIDMMLENEEADAVADAFVEAGRGSEIKYNVQKYTLEQTRSKINKYFEELYPLEEPTPEQKELYPEKVLIRRPPYENGEWRNVGVTAEIVKRICKEDKLAVHILYSDRLIQSCYPDGWVPGKHNACVCFNIWSDHGFFYDGSAEKSAAIKRNNPSNETPDAFAAALHQAPPAWRERRSPWLRRDAALHPGGVHQVSAGEACQGL